MEKSVAVQLATVLCYVLMEIDEEEQFLCCALQRSSRELAQILHKSTEDGRKGGVAGRRWIIVQNDVNWMFNFALKPDFISSPQWRADFRVPYPLFARLCTDLTPYVQKSDSSFRNSLAVEIRVGAFLMWLGGRTFSSVAAQLGIGTSSMTAIVRLVSRSICDRYSHEVRLPRTDSELREVMNGFESIAGLPYCVGAIDGSHIRWPVCPSSQFFEYKCYKQYTSLILFAVCDASRRFLYADVGMPGVMGDSTLFSISELKRQIDTGEWIGTDVPSLSVGGQDIRPYLLGDCAFPLGPNVMKTTTRTQQKLNADLMAWERVAAATRKPIECAFGILKNRFAVLKDGLKLHHEHDASMVMRACVLLHNLCLGIGDNGHDFNLTLLYEQENTVAPIECEGGAGKRTRTALLTYVLSK